VKLRARTVVIPPLMKIVVAIGHLKAKECTKSIYVGTLRRTPLGAYSAPQTI